MDDKYENHFHCGSHVQFAGQCMLQSICVCVCVCVRACVRAYVRTCERVCLSVRKFLFVCLLFLLCVHVLGGGGGGGR